MALVLWLAIAWADDAQRGAQIANLAGCAACHTAPHGAPYAGGYALETPFGVFYGPNLTPDPDHGIGSWTQDDFTIAVRHGRSPDGTPYYPSFPYPAYSALDDEDIADLWAHLRTVAPEPTPRHPHELTRYRRRGVLFWWRLLEFTPGPDRPPPPALSWFRKDKKTRLNGLGQRTNRQNISNH